MTNNIFRMIDGKMFHSVSLAFREYDSYIERDSYASGACWRFLQAASLLSDGECLGLQIAARHRDDRRVLAYSSSGVAVTQDDFRWIFHHCSAGISSDSSPIDGSCQSSRQVYLLQYAESRVVREGIRDAGKYDYDDDDRSSPVGEKCFGELLTSMDEANGIIHLLASSSGQGVILISLPEEMTLRMRTMLSMTFPNTAAVDVTYFKEEAPHEPAGLSAEQFRLGLSGLLSALMMKRSEKEPASDKQLSASPAPVAAGQDRPVNGTPIDDLDLSVRSYNCLKRSGYHYIEDLYSLTEDDLMQIRNLGRKGVIEIRQKLSEVTGKAAFAPSPLEEPDYFAMLDELIGLNGVKGQIRKIASFARMKQEMDEQGRKTLPLVLNMEFTGNPGTAKTTVARIVAGIFHQLGLLSGSKLVEVGRADLVARYEGQTADKVRSVFQRAEGKLLFIDEAYSLVENTEGTFGDEAINTIVQEMENRRDRTIVIFAGYPDKMEEFFLKNPGLRSRVPFRIDFSDYSAGEMVQIARLEAKKRGFAIRPDAEKKVASICAQAALNPGMGNGRFCRNLVENAILEYASRVYGSGKHEGVHDYVLTEEDFLFSHPADVSLPERKIGFAA